jgi:hypothetical protein
VPLQELEKKESTNQRPNKREKSSTFLSLVGSLLKFGIMSVSEIACLLEMALLDSLF